MNIREAIVAVLGVFLFSHHHDSPMSTMLLLCNVNKRPKLNVAEWTNSLTALLQNSLALSIPLTLFNTSV